MTSHLLTMTIPDTSPEKNNKYAQCRRECLRDMVRMYKKEGRHNLPWRKDVRSYSILVSEIMLQQTQVTRVIPKYKAWMKKWPTLLSLRRATLKDVLTLWKGLGYVRRAKALFEIAQTIDRIPKDEALLRTLPGVGKYTASAIVTFAYNKKVTLVETNIRSVVIHHFSDLLKDQVHDKDIEYIIGDMLAHTTLSPREFYWACMDYGSHLKETYAYNHRSVHYKKQAAFRGSVRELRGKTLHAILTQGKLPDDVRVSTVLETMTQEGLIKPLKKGGFAIA